MVDFVKEVGKGARDLEGLKRIVEWAMRDTARDSFGRVGQAEGLEEMVELLTSVLMEAHEVATLMDLALARVVEEGLEVRELPATLGVQVRERPGERQDAAREVLAKIKVAYKLCLQRFFM